MTTGQEDRKPTSSGCFWREVFGGAHVAALGRWAAAQDSLDEPALAIQVVDLARIRNGVAEVGDATFLPRFTHAIQRSGVRELA